MLASSMFFYSFVELLEDKDMLASSFSFFQQCFVPFQGTFEMRLIFLFINMSEFNKISSCGSKTRVHVNLERDIAYSKKCLLVLMRC